MPDSTNIEVVSEEQETDDMNQPRDKTMTNNKHRVKGTFYCYTHCSDSVTTRGNWCAGLCLSSCLDCMRPNPSMNIGKNLHFN